MWYNPDVHHRRSTRLRGFDYSHSGAYFITICTHERECLFDDPRLKRVAEMQWRSVGRYCRGVTMDEFVVMPNHVHGIIWIAGRNLVGAQHTAIRGVVSDREPRFESRGTIDPSCAAPLPPVQPSSLAAVVRAFKSASTKRVNELRQAPNAPVWQRNYWDRIIRSERELNIIRQYIIENPLRWSEDPNHPDNAVTNPCS